MKRALLAVAAACALMASPAAALTVVKDFTITAGNNANANTPFSIGQFDTTLGTLNSVTLTFSDHLITSGSVGNKDNGVNGNNYKLSQSAGATITGGGFDLTAALLDQTDTFHLAGKNRAGYTPFNLSTTKDNQATYTLTGDLSAFLGSGNVDFMFDRNLDYSFVTGGSNAVLSLLASSISGQGSVTYNYTAAPPVITPPTGPLGGVPEPATWAMMIFGFGVTGGVLRRRRDQVAMVAAA